MKLLVATLTLFAALVFVGEAHAKPLFTLDYECTGRDYFAEYSGPNNFTVKGSVPLLYQEEVALGNRIYQQITFSSETTFAPIMTTPGGHSLYLSFFAHRLFNVRPGMPLDHSLQMKTDLHIALAKVHLLLVNDESYQWTAGGLSLIPASEQIDQGLRLAVGEPLSVAVNQIMGYGESLNRLPHAQCTLKLMPTK